MSDQEDGIKGAMSTGVDMGPADSVERGKQKQQDRIAEFRTYGVKAQVGYAVLGHITFSATEAEELLRLLRRLEKLVGAQKDLIEALRSEPNG